MDEILKDFREKRGSELDSAGIIHKAFTAPASWNPEKRTVRFIMASEEEDRLKDIVRIGGMDLKRFRQNPIALIFHSQRDFPIGKWTDVRRAHDDQGTPILEGTLQFLPEGLSDLADTAANMVAHGVIRAVSVGFLPTKIKWREDKDENGERIYGFDIVKSELLECSLVNVPAQQAALAKGMVPEGITSEAIDWSVRNYVLKEGVVIHRSLLVEKPQEPDDTDPPKPTVDETKKFFVTDPNADVEVKDQDGEVLWRGKAGDLTNDSVIRASGLTTLDLADPELVSEERKGVLRSLLEGLIRSLKAPEPAVQEKRVVSGQHAYLVLSEKIARGKPKLRERVLP